MVNSMSSQWIFTGVVVLLGVQRLIELIISRRNEKRILVQGGQEHAPEHFPTMKVLHISWLIAAPLEVFALGRPYLPWLSGIAILALVVGQILRYSAIAALGPLWTVKIMTLPGSTPIDRGVYRYIRHPNYLGVILEVAAVPLLHSAFITATVFSIFNLLLLRVRINSEERALQATSPYLSLFGNKPRFLPKLK
jgi:methyltransferase